MSNVKPTKVCTVHQQPAKLFHCRHLKESYELNNAFEKADRLLEQKRTVPAVSFTILCH
jgi:hypothetical protein